MSRSIKKGPFVAPEPVSYTHLVEALMGLELPAGVEIEIKL